MVEGSSYNRLIHKELLDHATNGPAPGEPEYPRSIPRIPTATFIGIGVAQGGGHHRFVLIRGEGSGWQDGDDDKDEGGGKDKPL